jgi:hypothetical protein
MHKFLIAALGVAGLAGVLTGTASATKIEMSQSELKDFCDKKGGSFSTYGDGSSKCQIGSGKDAMKVSCTKNGNCVLERTVVFTLNRSIHGPIGQAVTTLGNSGKPSASGSASGASTSAGGETSTNGVSNTKKPGTGTSNSIGASGGGLPLNSRPPLRQQ